MKTASSIMTNTFDDNDRLSTQRSKTNKFIKLDFGKMNSPSITPHSNSARDR